MIEQLNTPTGRFYRTPDGIFPSVTTVLSSIPNPGLDEWRRAVGEEEAQKISRKATQTGTRMHSFCENYLLGKNPKLDLIDKFQFGPIVQELKKIEPVGIEKSLWSKKLKIAGSIDCIGKYEREWSIIDFKSASKDKFKEDISNYFLQTAAYSVMVYERIGLVIPRLTIIIQTINENVRVYHEPANKWIPKFIEVRKSFNREYTPINDVGENQ